MLKRKIWLKGERCSDVVDDDLGLAQVNVVMMLMLMMLLILLMLLIKYLMVLLMNFMRVLLMLWCCKTVLHCSRAWLKGKRC